MCYGVSEIAVRVRGMIFSVLLCLTQIGQALTINTLSTRFSDDAVHTAARVLLPRYRLYSLVSFSMPAASLKAIARQLQPYHGTIVLRGLVHQSFKETLQKIQTVWGTALVNIEIDPLKFRRFKVAHVPTVILLSNQSASSYDKVSGDVPICAALHTIERSGEHQKLAQQLIQLGEVR